MANGKEDARTLTALNSSVNGKSRRTKLFRTRFSDSFDSSDVCFGISAAIRGEDLLFIPAGSYCLEDL
jgi:hypothetical protein